MHSSKSRINHNCTLRKILFYSSITWSIQIILYTFNFLTEQNFFDDMLLKCNLQFKAGNFIIFCKSPKGKSNSKQRNEKRDGRGNYDSFQPYFSIVLAGPGLN